MAGDIERASAFIHLRGERTDIAQLEFTLHGTTLGKAITRELLAGQRADGGWPSEDGPDREAHVTLEAIRALRWSDSEP